MSLALGSLYREAIAALSDGAVPTPQLDARWLVAAAAAVEPADIILRENRPVDAGVAAQVREFVARRLSGEPVDRILRMREFWGLRFRLSAATLSPRPDTETVVEAALAALADPDRPWRILDLGTGSGAILVALLRECRRASGVGVDLSPLAAATARDNAADNGVATRAGFVVGDWADALHGTFDLVVSNPPYISRAEIPALSIEVRDHDPVAALDGGDDGLEAYRSITAAAPALLAPQGALVLELGFGQEAEVAALCVAAGLTPAPARRDLGGVPRALVARPAA